jgi:hypothetical protein
MVNETFVLAIINVKKLMKPYKGVTPVNPGWGAGAGSGVQNLCNY